MSSPLLLSLVLLFASSSLLLQGSLGEIVCEDLPREVCAFSIASSGKRCLLENYENDINGKTEYQCTTSQVVVDLNTIGVSSSSSSSEYIETDECVKACGLDRNSLGISSDTLLEAQSISNICSPACYNNCPNIRDLYFNLAAAEGVSLPELCEKQRSNPHRAMIELLSSGAAPGPTTSDNIVGSPGPAAPGPIASENLVGSPAPASI